MVAVPTTAAKHRPDVPVDRLHLPEGDLDVAIGEDAVEVTTEELGDLVKGREPLPAQRPHPGGQKAPRRAFVGVVPKVPELLLEQMAFGEPPVEGEKGLELLPFASIEIPPGTEQQPPLAAQHGAGGTAVAEEFSASRFVQRVVDVAQDVEFVVHDP